jgi:uncharacterized membrane protein
MQFLNDKTDLFGIPIPSTDKVFLTFVVIHILIALVSIISGLIAILSLKGSTRHRKSGQLYVWSMTSAFVTIVILSMMRWPHNNHLLLIGFFAFGFTFAGYRLSKVQRKNWTRLHTICMGSSYIFLLTGFYVDNGKNLPFWKLFPQWFLWGFPATLGIPIILYVLNRHPLNKKVN